MYFAYIFTYRRKNECRPTEQATRRCVETRVARQDKLNQYIALDFEVRKNATTILRHALKRCVAKSESYDGAQWETRNWKN